MLRWLEIEGVAPSDEDLLLAVLNTAPVVAGRVADELAEPASARGWLAAHVGAGDDTSDAGLAALRATRDALHRVVRGHDDAGALAAVLRGVRAEAVTRPDGVSWQLQTSADDRLAVRVALAWDAVQRGAPGRLRACANEECNLFLLDRSKSGSARWCSMATCGNRMKARRHQQRERRPGEV